MKTELKSERVKWRCKFAVRCMCQSRAIQRWFKYLAVDLGYIFMYVAGPPLQFIKARVRFVMRPNSELAWIAALPCGLPACAWPLHYSAPNLSLDTLAETSPRAYSYPLVRVEVKVNWQEGNWDLKYDSYRWRSGCDVTAQLVICSKEADGGCRKVSEEY